MKTCTFFSDESGEEVSDKDTFDEEFSDRK